MREIIENILIGAIGSLVATIILFFGSSCYRFGYKKIIMYNLNLALNYIYQILNFQTFINDYDKIMHCVERIHECVFVMYENIYPLSKFYAPKNKRLIQTLLYDIQSKCERAMFQTVGYNGDTEREARLKCIKKLFIMGDKSVVKVELKLIEALLQKRNIRLAMNELKKAHINCEQINKIIECRSFKNSSNNEIIQKKGMTKEEFDDIFN